MSTKASVPGYCMTAIWSQGTGLADQDLEHVVVEGEHAPPRRTTWSSATAP